MPHIVTVKELWREYPGLLLATAIIGALTLAIVPLYSVAMICVGSFYMNDCTLDPIIPKWLIVHAVFTSFVTIYGAISFSIFSIIKSDRPKMIFGGVSLAICIFFGVFILAWFIVGNVKIFSNTAIVVYSNSTSSSYCNQNLYLFTYATLILEYVWVFWVVLFALASFIVYTVFRCIDN